MPRRSAGSFQRARQSTTYTLRRSSTTSTSPHHVLSNSSNVRLTLLRCALTPSHEPYGRSWHPAPAASCPPLRASWPRVRPAQAPLDRAESVKRKPYPAIRLIIQIASADMPSSLSLVTPSRSARRPARTSSSGNRKERSECLHGGLTVTHDDQKRNGRAVMLTATLRLLAMKQKLKEAGKSTAELDKHMYAEHGP